MHCIEFPHAMHKFDAVHRIPIERMGLSTGIHENSMQCIEFPLKAWVFQLEFDALHRIPVESLVEFDALDRIPVYYHQIKLI